MNQQLIRPKRIRSIGALLKLYISQNSIVFRPSEWKSETPANMGMEYEEVWLSRWIGHPVHGWWVPAVRDAVVSTSPQAVIYFHGSDGNISQEVATIRFLHNLGLNVLIVDYPGYGLSKGWPNEHSCYHSAEVAWRHCSRVRQFESQNIFIYGQSVGCAVGVFLARRHRCAGMIFQSGFTSVPDLATWLFPRMPAHVFSWSRMNSLRRVRHLRCPILFIHSHEDDHIPIRHAMRLYTRSQSPKKLVQLEGAHWSQSWRSNQAVRRAWQELLNRDFTQWEA